MSKKKSEFIVINRVPDDYSFNVFGNGVDREIPKPDLFSQIKDESFSPFIYPTIELLQNADLEADDTNPTYVRCEETEYRLYKITNLAPGVDDIALDNGNTATYQLEYRDVGFVVGPATSAAGSLAVFTDTGGAQLDDLLVPTNAGKAFMQAADSASVSFPRKNADNSVSMLGASTYFDAVKQLSAVGYSGTIETASDASTLLQVATDEAITPSNLAALKASSAEVITGANTVKYVTPETLQDKLDADSTIIVENVAALASTPVVPGTVYYLKEYHAGTGIGGGNLEAYTSLDTPNNGTIFASGTAGVRLKRINTEIFISHFGADPTGLTDSSSAVNLAIAYANSIGGDDATNITGVTIHIDRGRFLINSALTPIIKSGINVVGSSENGSVLLLKNGTTSFTWGNGTNTVVGGGLSNCKLEYLTNPSGSTIAINLNNAFRLNFNNLLLVNVGTLASLGVSSSAIAGGITFSNINGFVSNAGFSLFDLRYGAGLFLDNIHVFVGGVGNPKNTSFTGTTATNVLTVTIAPLSPLAVGDIIHGVGIAGGTTIASFGTGTGGTGTYNLSTSPGTLSSRTFNATAPMTTVAGTNVFKCSTGFWDTLQATNVIFERFYDVMALTAASGMTYQNFFFSNFVADYIANYGFYLESQSGGVCSAIRFSKDCWLSCWNADAFIFLGSGYHDNHDINGTITIAGLRAVSYALTTARSNTFNLTVNSVNRRGTAAAALEFAANSTGFKLLGCTGNIDTTNVGLPWRAPYAVQILADCDYFSVSSCDFSGSTAGYNVDPANAAGSSNRRIFNNIGANYAGYQAIAVPASTVRYTNKSAMVQEWSFFGGTITGGYDKNLQGFPGALQYVTMRLQPGDSYSVGYSVAPTSKTFIEP